MDSNPFVNKELKITVIGGGTGSLTLLSSLKFKTSQLVAFISITFAPPKAYINKQSIITIKVPI